MVFRTEPHLERARAHLESGDADRLPYACLELRYALERIAYQKLQLRLGKISAREIAGWQPRRAIETLAELVDDRLGENVTMRIAREPKDGKPHDEDYVMLGESKGVSPREIGRHWHKLGSFLHVRVPKKKGDYPDPPDEAPLHAYLGEVIEYIEQLTSTGFDLHFSKNVSFHCSKCGQSIVRNCELLEDGAVVQCQNPHCTASYLTHAEDGGFRFEFYQLRLDCKGCGESSHIEANTFLGMERDEARRFVCPECGTVHLVRWMVQYALEDEALKGPKGP